MTASSPRRKSRSRREISFYRIQPMAGALDFSGARSCRWAAGSVMPERHAEPYSGRIQVGHADRGAEQGENTLRHGWPQPQVTARCNGFHDGKDIEELRQQIDRDAPAITIDDDLG